MAGIMQLGLWQVTFWWVTACVLFAAGWVTYGGQHRNPRHDRELTWLIWHWVTGGHLENARLYPEGGSITRRVALRAGTGIGRTALTAGFFAAIHLRSGAHGGILSAVVWGLVAAGAMAAVTVLVARVAVKRSMFRHYIRPLHWPLAGAAGWPLDLKPKEIRRYITIRPGLASSGDGVVVVCGPTFEPRGDNEKRVVEIVTAKLGLSSVSVDWKREGIHRYAQFRRQEPVPAKVPFRNRDIRALIEEESTPSKVLLGLTRGDKPVWLDLDKQAPHVLMSAGTGGGKTAALTAFIAQLMWHGAEVVVLDFKRISHLWLRDLPGVRYARSIEEIHRTAVWLGEEVDRRTSAWDPVTFDQREAGLGPKFPRLVIVCEEMSSTMDYLRDHWTDTRESSDPKRSPAVKGLAKALNMGREIQMNTLTVAQRAEANAVGNGAMRENYPCKVMIDRYSKQTWTLLAPECAFVPGVSHPGRAQVCIGATATETQLLWITQRDAQRWVIDKRGQQPVAQAAHPVPPGETVRDCRADATDQGVQPVTLWEASKDKGRGVVSLTAGALRAERARHPGEFPAPVGQRGNADLYDPFDLQRWELNKVKLPTSRDHDEVEGEQNEIDGVDREVENTGEVAGDVLRAPVATTEPPRRDNDRDRFEAKIDRSNPDGCHPWTGATSSDGYGYTRDADGRVVPVHRLAYELYVGPIPDGLTIDHLMAPDGPCTTKTCTRGDHLQAVTREVNSARRHAREAALRAQQGATPS